MSRRNYSPSYADRKLNIQAAKIAAKSPVMDRVAAAVLASVKAVAERHRVSGGYVDSLEVIRTRGRNGVEDRKVISTAPQATAVEYGHLAGKKDAPNRTFVEGQFIMTQAANAYRKGH